MIKRICKYQKISKVGEGTYGVVYKAKDLQTNEIVALKKVRLKPEEEGTPSTSIREIALLKELNHPNVIQLIDVIHTNTKLTLVFEFCENDLRKEMDKPTPLTKTPMKIKLYLYQMLQGISYIHKKRILHRDLKPQNLLINSKGVMKICDFGLARGYSLPVRNYTNEVVTLWYRPPDVLLGYKLYETSVDIWSIGCIFSEMLLGRPIFEGKNETEQLQKIFTAIGSPSEEEYPWLVESPEWINPDSICFKKLPKRDIKESLREIIDQNAVDLISKMLVFDPEKRISAEEALEHPYFDSVKELIDEIYNK